MDLIERLREAARGPYPNHQAEAMFSALCDQAAADIERLTAERDALRAALSFYARPIAYDGSNQRNQGQDPFTPTDAPYIIDVMRDLGRTARNALHEQRTSAGPEKAAGPVPVVRGDRYL